MAYRIVAANDITKNPDIAIGVKFPFNGKGIFSKSFTTDEQASTNIKSLLLTRKGERFEQPNFGTDLLNVLFEPITIGIKEFIEETITSAVSFWLPYIEISRLDVVTSEDDDTLVHEIKISIGFSVIGTGSEQTIIIFADQNGIVRIE
jgi:phage baseplate assembly protein W